LPAKKELPRWQGPPVGKQQFSVHMHMHGLHARISRGLLLVSDCISCPASRAC
jgi:hypothetical protein